MLGVLGVAGRRVNPEGTSFTVERGGFLIINFHRAVGHITSVPERRRGGGHFEQAGRSAGAELHARIGGVGDGEAVNGEGIDVDAGLKRGGGETPDTDGVFGHLLHGSDGHPIAVKADVGGLRGLDAEGDSAIGVDLRRDERGGLGLEERGEGESDQEVGFRHGRSPLSYAGGGDVGVKGLVCLDEWGREWETGQLVFADCGAEPIVEFSFWIEGVAGRRWGPMR